MTRRAAVQVVVLACLLGMLVMTGSTLAQGTNAIHVVLTGGSSPGTYDVTTSEPCREGESGPGDWAITYEDPGGIPDRFDVTFSADPDYDTLNVSFGGPGAGGAYSLDNTQPPRSTIDDRGGSVTLTMVASNLKGYVTDGVDHSGGTATITVECHALTRQDPYVTPAAVTAAPSLGPTAWTGTITLRAVVDHHKTEAGSDQDPNSAYYDTFVHEDTIQGTATDVLTIAANDPPDVSNGIGRVELGGPAANDGSTDEISVTTWQKKNSGCTWTEEGRDETAGSWTGAGTVHGELVFSEDGTYELDLHPAWSDSPGLTDRYTDTVSDLSAGCEGQGFQNETPTGPTVARASELLEHTDVNDMRPQLTGSLDSSDPGTMVAGSGTWQMRYPEDTTLTVEWQLVHDGPIVLPH